jgi:hypothetical protein
MISPFNKVISTGMMRIITISILLLFIFGCIFFVWYQITTPASIELRIELADLNGLRFTGCRENQFWPLSSQIEGTANIFDFKHVARWEGEALTMQLEPKRPKSISYLTAKDKIAPHWLGDFYISIDDVKVEIFEINSDSIAYNYDSTTENIILDIYTDKSKFPLKIFSPYRDKLKRRKFKTVYHSEKFESILLKSNDLDSTQIVFPSVTVLFNEDHNFSYDWFKESNISIDFLEKIGLKKTQGIDIEHLFLYENMKAKVKQQADVEGNAEIRIYPGDKSFLLISKEMFFAVGRVLEKTINERQYTTGITNMKYYDDSKQAQKIIHIIPGKQTKPIKVNMTGVRADWSTFSSIHNQVNFRFYPLSTKAVIQNPLGIAYLDNKEFKLNPLTILEIEFDGFPSVTNKIEEEFPKYPESYSFPLLYISGFTTSFKANRKELVPRKWEFIPAEVRGAIVGVLLGFISFLLSKALDRILGGKDIQKIQIVEKDES